MTQFHSIARLFRTLVFTLVSIFLIFVSLVPNQFYFEGIGFQHALFAWVAAFTIRRPGSVNLFALLLISLIYAGYVDEGIALGSLALIVMHLILHQWRNAIHSQVFPIEWLIVTSCYASVLIAKNILLFVFVAPHYTVAQLFVFIFYFFVTYLVFNLIIFILFRSNNTEIES